MNVESANAQDARVEALWNTFDTDHHGYLSLSDLRKGLRKMDHRKWSRNVGQQVDDWYRSSQKRPWHSREDP